MANQNPDLARAFPTSNVQGHHRTLARNGRRLLYQQQIRLKKIAHRRKRKRVEEVRGTIQIATLNIGSLTGRGQEIVDLMNRRRINIICVQETKWKGCKVREIGNGFKLFYNGSDGKRNGVGIILNDNIKKGVLSVKRQSDRIIWMRVNIAGEIVNIMSAYAPQMGYDEEDLEEDLREIPE
ncbi:craniofacial development protein 2-like [Penaeus vannamei]|uniref:craniofacial development protein 2-like n=1 Tax=Penaeus vannamei TaxID=6689 RepID=UPI00387FA374